MPDMRRLALLSLLSLLLSGCSLNTLQQTITDLTDLIASGEEQEPAELVDFEPEIELYERWSVLTGEGQGLTYNRLQPVVYGNQIFIADVEGVIAAYDRFTGSLDWEVELEDVSISGGIGYGDGLLLLGTLQGDVLALDVSDGQQVWKTSVNSEVLAPPMTNGNIVVAQTLDDTLVALDADSGYKRWSYESPPALLTLRGTSTPLVTPQVTLAGLSTGKVVMVENQRGIPIWEQRIMIPQGRTELERVVDVDANLLLTGGLLYVVTYQGKLAALDPQSGRVLWQRDASSYAGMAEGYGSLYVTLDGGTVQALDERSTSVLWQNDKLARRQLSAPAVFSSYVAVGDYEGYLHVLSQIDGRFVARVEINATGWKIGHKYGVRVRPLVVGDWIYVYGDDGGLVALSLTPE